MNDFLEPHCKRALVAVKSIWMPTSIRIIEINTFLQFACLPSAESKNSEEVL